MLVGGFEHPDMSKIVGVWGADSKAWMHPYPAMPTARCRCSAIAYNQWLVVAGGYGSDSHLLSCVEVLNIDSKQWYAGPPTLRPWGSMKTAVVGDTGYFMGDTYTSTNVYSVSLPALVSQLSADSGERDRQIWKKIPGLQLTRSAPLSISGFLLAIGGMDEDDNIVTTINLYQPNTGDWMKVGDLPSPRYDCTCVMITDREVLVAGGWYLKTVHIALVST